jgi:hypothetical protein
MLLEFKKNNNKQNIQRIFNKKDGNKRLSKDKKKNFLNNTYLTLEDSCLNSWLKCRQVLIILLREQDMPKITVFDIVE